VIIPAGYAQVNYRFSGTGLPNGAEITMGYALADPAPTPAALCSDLAAIWVTSDMDSLYTSSATLSSVAAKYGPNATGPSAELGVSVAGTMAGEGIAPNVTWLIRKNTGFGGRSGRGRFFLPQIGETAVNAAGAIVGATVTAAQVDVNAWHSNCVTAGYVPTLLHSAASGIPITDPLPIVSFTVDSRVATQRRRLRR